MSDEAWLWHARYGHLNFRSLHELGAQEMVEGIPVIRRAEQVCDGCALGKHHITPFPRASSFRAEAGLELVHGDLCGPITPETLSSNKYFLLLVDDRSRFMWLTVLPSKDRAAAAIREFQARAEG